MENKNSKNGSVKVAVGNLQVGMWLETSGFVAVGGTLPVIEVEP
jgi:hypothetical protein